MITPFMALVDCVPVVLFLIAAVILQRDLYYRLPKGAYTIMAGGTIMVFTGGFFKALWKVLYGLKVCDYLLLSYSFFPLQGPGFLLFFLGLTGIFYKPDKKKVYTSVIPVFISSLPFIIMQVLGLGLSQVLLMYMAVKKKNYKGFILFIFAFVGMLGMGYLGAKFDNSSSMHWIAQVTNILSMGFFLWGTLEVRKTNYID